MNSVRSIYTCLGCGKHETYEWNNYNERSLKIKDMMSRGWQQRALWSSNLDKNLWFCSYECAYISNNVKMIENLYKLKGENKRQKEFEEFCQKTATGTIWIITAFAFVGLIFLLMVLLLK